MGLRSRSCPRNWQCLSLGLLCSCPPEEGTCVPGMGGGQGRSLKLSEEASEVEEHTTAVSTTASQARRRPRSCALAQLPGAGGQQVTGERRSLRVEARRGHTCTEKEGQGKSSGANGTSPSGPPDGTWGRTRGTSSSPWSEEDEGQRWPNWTRGHGTSRARWTQAPGDVAGPARLLACAPGCSSAPRGGWAWHCADLRLLAQVSNTIEKTARPRVAKTSNDLLSEEGPSGRGRRPGRETDPAGRAAPSPR